MSIPTPQNTAVEEAIKEFRNEHGNRTSLNFQEQWLRSKLEEMVRVGREENEKLYEETNIKKLIEEMEANAEEYGQYHDEDCQVNLEGGADFGYECKCEKILAIKTYAREWMAKVNHMWVTNLQNHRKYCRPDGNKDLTRTKNRLSALTQK